MKRLVLVLSAGLAGCAHGPPEAPPVRLDLIAINDFHGHLEPPPSGLTIGDTRSRAGGVAYLAAHVAAVRAEAEHSLLVSAGDLIGASPLVSALFHDEPTIEAMNALRLDLNAVGNHELDEGLDELLRMVRGGCHPEDGCGDRPRFEGARFPFLGANIVDRRTGAPAFPSTAVREVGGVEVGFIGLTLEGTADVLPPVVPELDFLDEAEVANAQVRALLADGVRAIVVLLHEGGFASSDDPNACDGLSGPVLEVVERLHPEVDVVVSGHTHQAYVCPLEGLLLTSAGSFGQLYTLIAIELDPGSGDVLSATAENRVVHHDLSPVASLTELVAAYREQAAPLADRVVTHVREALTRTPTPAGVSSLGRVIADAQLAATRSAGAELAFVNPGGIRAAIDPVLGADGLGEVTYGMLFAVQPFGNHLVTMSLTGAQILSVLDGQSWGRRSRLVHASANLAYRWRPGGPDRPREVVPESVRVSGAPLEPDRVYRVTVNAYMATRGVFAEGTVRVNGPMDIEALVAHLASRDPFRAPPLDGVERVSLGPEPVRRPNGSP